MKLIGSRGGQPDANIVGHRSKTAQLFDFMSSSGSSGDSPAIVESTTTKTRILLFFNR